MHIHAPAPLSSSPSPSLGDFPENVCSVSLPLPKCVHVSVYVDSGVYVLECLRSVLELKYHLLNRLHGVTQAD